MVLILVGRWFWHLLYLAITHASIHEDNVRYGHVNSGDVSTCHQYFLFDCSHFFLVRTHARSRSLWCNEPSHSYMLQCSPQRWTESQFMVNGAIVGCWMVLLERSWQSTKDGPSVARASPLTHFLCCKVARKIDKCSCCAVMCRRSNVGKQLSLWTPWSTIGFTATEPAA